MCILFLCFIRYLYLCFVLLLLLLFLCYCLILFALYVCLCIVLFYFIYLFLLSSCLVFLSFFMFKI